MIKKSWYKFVSVVLCFSIVIGMSCFLAVSAESSTGTVTADSVRIRTGAGTDNSQLKASDGSLIYISTGHKVTILKTENAKKDTVNKTWYQIKFTYGGKEYTGYIATQFVAVDPPEQDFTMPEGVPDEYKSYIENILKYYPNWKFVFYDTGLEWNSLFGTDQQGYVGRSLIPASDPIYYRSTAAGCYNSQTGTYIMQDAGGWYQANTQTIAYYMDPRNFLNVNDVFMFESLSYDKDTQTLAGVEKILDGSFMDGVKITDTNNNQVTYAEAYINAAKTAQVSPYHLASRTIQEVGKNGSGSTSGNYGSYKGYYNFYNIGATQGADPISNGLRYASGATSSYENKVKYMLPWNTQYKSIVGGAIWIGTGYINSVYKQNTMYFQKFNTSGKNPAHQYMGNIKAPYNEAHSIKQAYNEMGMLNSSFTFIVPYYRNMPKTACQLPTGATPSSDNSLYALYFIDDSTGKDYISGFNSGKLNWDIGTLDSKNFTVKATPNDSKATVSGTGKITLKEGKNTVEVVVTAENGSKRTYTITVNVPVTEPPEPAIIIGDVDLNGKIEIYDALLIFKYKTGELELSENGKKAADTDKNGEIQINDALRIFKYKSGEISSF